ncbi:MAG: HNH endonuclease [Planctomycetes bacterium]|nr:HNH endonuclease [Planctomycetota bacterium]
MIDLLSPNCGLPRCCCSTAEEVWRDIPGFQDYQASDLGRIRSRKSGAWQMLQATPHSKTGYLVVSPRVGGRYVARSVHRLVAAAFLGEAHGRDVNHKNGDKHDNRLQNLEYLSRGENHRHAYRTGLRGPVGSKLGCEQVRQIASLKGRATQRDIARQFGVSCATVSLIHHGKRYALLLVQ